MRIDIRKFSFLLLFAAALLIPRDIAVQPQSVQAESRITAVLTQLDVYLQEVLDVWEVPGMAVAIVENGQPIFLRGYGVRHKDHPGPVDEHTVFRLASVSKCFTSTLAGLLAGEGLFDFDDPVIQYLPDLSLADSAHTRALTLRHLLSHTTGLMPHAYDNLLEANISYERIIDALHEVPILASPGEQYGYQNVLFSLIGDVMESVTGESFNDLMENRIFQPLGMKDASMNWDGLMAAQNRACPHRRRYYRYTPVGDKKAYFTVPPAAGVNASITDMAKWLCAVMGNDSKTIPLEILKETQSPVIHTPGEIRRFPWNGGVRDAHYGLGWRIFDYQGRTVIHHSGSVEGYMSDISFIPDQNIGIAVLFNGMPYDFISPTFFDLYFESGEAGISMN